MQAPANETDYVLGHEPAELKRLAAQSDYWAEPTLELLTRAGIAPGMRVLDLGSGGGDVTFLAARMVGETGSVLGIDRSETAVAAAGRRAREMSLNNVGFETGNLDALNLDGRFDAVIGRLVLLYVAEPARVLASVAKNLGANGILAFLEMEMHSAHSVPDVPAFGQVHDWLIEGFRRAGTKTDLGPRLWRAFRDAGLPQPQMFAYAKMEAAPAIAGTTLLVETLRSLLPMLEATGVVTARELQIDALAQRLQRALSEAQATLVMPSMVGSWTRLSS
ncbi:MAG TPA: methyltransferase domain-containing protein [Steroidobacteraceae bacterium]